MVNEFISKYSEKINEYNIKNLIKANNILLIFNIIILLYLRMYLHSLILFAGVTIISKFSKYTIKKHYCLINIWIIYTLEVFILASLLFILVFGLSKCTNTFSYINTIALVLIEPIILFLGCLYTYISFKKKRKIKIGKYETITMILLPFILVILKIIIKNSSKQVALSLVMLLNAIVVGSLMYYIGRICLPIIYLIGISNKSDLQ